MNQIRLTGAVMAHPRRLDAAHALIESAPPGFLELVLDPDPSGPPTGLRTSIRAWSEIPAGATHHLVLEDDAQLSAGFAAQAERAVAANPDAAIVLYNNWSSRNGSAVRLGALAGTRWVTPVDEYTANVALILPAVIGAGFADYAREHGGTWPDDVVLARYLTSVGAVTYLAVPNLVEHGEFPSISGNDLHGLRMSACCSAVEPDADWGLDGTLRPDAVPFFKFGLAQCSIRQGDRWLTIGGERYSRRLGIDVDHCLKELDAAAAATGLRASGLVPDATLEAFWRTGYALGLLSAEHESKANWRENPLVDKALDTLGPGGLCMELSSAELRKLQAPLKDLAWDALFAGARQPAHSTAGRPIVFAGPDSPLRRALVADLADRGHPVRTGSEVDGAEPEEVVVELDATEVHVRHRASVLRLGVPYGPGIDCSPLNDLVLQSLMKHPMRVAGPLPESFQFIHVWDLADVLERLVESPDLVGSFDVCDDRPITVRQLAELVTQVIRAVEIDLTEATAAPPHRPPLSAERTRSELAWRPSIHLADGIRTVGQWLAYEAD